MPPKRKQRKEESEEEEEEYQSKQLNTSKRNKRETLNFERGIEEEEDDFTELRDKIKKIFPILQQSKYTVCFTGSGISAASGLPIYRGKNGIWSEYEKKRKNKVKNGQLEDKDENKNGYKWLKGNSESKLKHLWFPNYTHMAISELMKNNLVHFVISQNCDDLHFQSGIPMEKMVELHGNCFLEECRHCKKIFRRDYLVAQPKLVPSTPQEDSSNEETSTDETSSSSRTAKEHMTSNLCEICKYTLYDTIINFNESVPDEKYQLAREHASKADVILVFGSSLAVEPANHLPRMGKQLIICNLDSTPLDDEASVVTKAKSDRFFEQIAGPEFLNLSIPSYQYTLDLKLEAKFHKSKQNRETWFVQLSNPNGGLENVIAKATLLPNLTSLRYPIDFLPKNSYTVKFICIDVVFHSTVEVKFNIRKHGSLDWTDDTLLLPCSIRFDQNNGDIFEQKYHLVFDTSFYRQQEKLARSFWSLQ